MHSHMHVFAFVLATCIHVHSPYSAYRCIQSALHSTQVTSIHVAFSVACAFVCIHSGGEHSSAFFQCECVADVVTDLHSSAFICIHTAFNT